MPYGMCRTNQGIRPRHCGSVKGRSCLTNSVSFHGKTLCFVDEEKSVLVFYLDFDTISHSILLEKLAVPGLDGNSCINHWVKNWLDGWAQSGGGEWSSSSWWMVTSGIPQDSVLEPVLLNVFIDVLEEGIKHILSQFLHGSRLGGNAGGQEGSAVGSTGWTSGLRPVV
ncbi:hypothetical protein DUI87_10441 [Hirundo rustica rustica]|uniref:Reverse transcriptase domain-containing protein n=1 Tax=Hirundo rustica rustica TaxID=333673 RepID=A0A3M0KNT2_HIRRU|nr:hypothetical protein DUI87_10441 [Hirundo rustica rustica]